MQDKLAFFIRHTEATQVPWQRIISSPLSRCAWFGQQLAEQHQLPLKTDDGFKEIDFGDWDGKPIEQIRQQQTTLFTKMIREPGRYRPPNGESFLQFQARVEQSWQQLINDYRGQRILLICHGGVIRALIAAVMQTPLNTLSRIETPYACLSQICIHHHADEADWPQLIFHNHRP